MTTWYFILALLAPHIHTAEKWGFVHRHKTEASALIAGSDAYELQDGYFNNYGRFVFLRVNVQSSKLNLSPRNAQLLTLRAPAIYNLEWRSDEPVYLYQCDALVPGKFIDSIFTPTGDDPIISMQEYLDTMSKQQINLVSLHTYAEKAAKQVVPKEYFDKASNKLRPVRRICNLPGTIVPATEFKRVYSTLSDYDKSLNEKPK